MNREISLSEVISSLKSKLPLIFFTTIIGVIIAFGITFMLITPKYSSTSRLIVRSKNVGSGTEQTSDISGNLLLMNTYKDIIKDNVVMDEVQKKMSSETDYNLNAGTINQMISIEQSENSQIFKVVATSDDPEKSAIVANTTVKAFQSKAKEILDVDKVTITGKAKPNGSPISPNKQKNILIGGIIGLVFGIVLAYLIEFFDKTVKNETLIISNPETPLLGVVNEMSKKTLMATSGKSLKKKENVNQDNDKKKKRNREKI